jgi:hypothetical protein
MFVEITEKWLTETRGELKAIVFDAPGKVRSVIIRCNRPTLIAALKKEGFGALIPRGYLKNGV